MNPHLALEWIVSYLHFVALVHCDVGGTVASWLAPPTPDCAVRARTLAGYIALCSWARHLPLTVPLTSQMYKWLLNLMLEVFLSWSCMPSIEDWKYS